MEFLVRIEQNISPDMDPDRLSALKKAEHARGTELAEAGIMRRIWRNPGRRGVWVLYEVDGPDELHAAVSSLPLFPWMDIEVFPLGSHALDPGPNGSEV
jgi:muconolactone D-isomerase